MTLVGARSSAGTTRTRRATSRSFVCKEDCRKRAQKIKVMCLMPAEGAPGALHTRVGAFKFIMYKLQLQVTSYELRATSYELQVTSYKLQVTSYK